MSNSRQQHHFLPAAAFSAAFLGALHSATFVWLTAVVYKGNIRGYVPAGIRAIMYLTMGATAVFVYMVVVGRRRGSDSYVLGGCLGVPIAVVVSSFATAMLVRVLGYSLATDVAVNAAYAVFSLLLAVVCYLRWLRRSLDRTPGPTRETAV